MYVCNVIIIGRSITEMYNVSVSVYFVSEGQSAQPPTVTVRQIVTERNEFLLFNNELEKG
jgi:hypothetical protein